MNILVAEDERITRRSLQRQLERWGHDVVATQDGAEAWEQFQQRPFDIVVTDWEMPRMDGRELVRCIRGAGQSSYTYLIMLTGRAEKSDLVAGMEAGADDFLAKPFDRNELRVRLSAGERIIRLERELAGKNQSLSQANERMKRDLDAAADMQRDLLPKQLPAGVGARFAWHYEPCDELGGDILNVLRLDDQHIAMYLLDVAGHGVPAALLSVTLSQVLTTRDPRSSILLGQNAGSGTCGVAPPRDVVQRLNQQFQITERRGQFFTMVFAVLNTETGSLKYTNAGHPTPILIRRGDPPQLLPGNGFPVGILDEAKYDEEFLQLEPGDRLYFYSDGVTEAFNDKNQMLETEGLIQLIEQTEAESLEDSLKACVGEFQHWCRPVALTDDISVLVLELPLTT